MPLIPTVTPEQAEGKMKAVYSMFTRKAGSIPKPLEMFSISPKLFEHRAGLLEVYGNHPKLAFPLLTLIRFLVAAKSCNNACIGFNQDLIKRQGMTSEDIAELIKDPLTAPLEDRECYLLKFVVTAINEPETIKKEDIDQLHQMDWTNEDIFDALNYGADMIGPFVNEINIMH